MPATSLNIEEIPWSERSTMRKFWFDINGCMIAVYGFSLGHAFKRLRGQTEGTVQIRPLGTEGATS